MSTNKTIDDLTAGVAITDTDKFAVWQGVGPTAEVNAANIATYLEAFFVTLDSSTAGQVALVDGANALTGEDWLYADIGQNLPRFEHALVVGSSQDGQTGLFFNPGDSGDLDGPTLASDPNPTIEPSGNMLAVQSSIPGINIYSSYDDPDNFDALSIQPHYIAIWNVSGGELVDTLLLITGEGTQGVILTDETSLKGWGTSVVGGDPSWTPCSHTGVLADNQFDIGRADARARSGYFGTSVVTPLVQSTPVALAALGSAVTAGAGSRACINDGLTLGTWGSAAVDGGVVVKPVWSNGVAWLNG